MGVKDLLKSFSRGSSAVSLPSDGVHTITISEATPRASLSQDSIEISIKVDTVEISRNGLRRLRDPFSVHDHAECEWYLGCCLREPQYDEVRVDNIVPSVRNYGGTLMSDLEWPAKTFIHPNINIDVLQTGRRTDIYHIHWEQLEQVEKRFWPGLSRSTNPLQVKVRRVIDHAPVKRSPSTKQGKEINVLLVIARRLKQGSSGLEDLSPAMVYHSIMKVKKVLHRDHSRSNVNLEVVRPGSFEALQDHLVRKEVEHGVGFFHLVHFDLHGEVSDEGDQLQQHKAYLSFANSSGRLSKISAERIAELLHHHEISCVVLTACESGKSNKGDDANLCRIFAEKGVSYILAMSFGVHEQAVEILCDSFYRHLLLKGKTFSESARCARLDLFERPERIGRNGRTRDLQDWFIPVAYVPKEEKPLIRKKQDRPSSASASRLDVHGLPLTYTSSYESTRSSIPPYSDFDVEMDTDVLRIEEILMRVGNVLLRGPIVEKNADLVDRLLSSWVSTGFLAGFEKVDAEEFFSPKADHDKRAHQISGFAQHISKKNITKKLRENYIEPQQAYKNKALRKAAIILTGIDKLFPKEKSTSDKKDAELEAALRRFDNFLRIVILDIKAHEDNDYKVPFLVIVGEDLGDKLTGKFVNQYPDLGLEAVFRDRPFDMFAF